MENQNRQNQRKESDVRISVRPGNFIVPGENAPSPAPQSAGGDSPRQSGNRHSRHRNRRRGGQGAPKAAPQGDAARAPAPQPLPEQKKPEQKRPEQKRPEQPAPQKNGGNQSGGQGGKKNRHGRHGRRDKQPQGRPASAPAAPEISASLKRELDADLAPTTSLFAPSPARAAERALESSVVDTHEFEIDIATAGYLIEDVPCGFPAPDGKTVEVIGVRFRQSGKVYFFDPAGERFRIGEAVIVDTARGPEFGEVALLNRKMAEKYVFQPLRAVLRRATEEDVRHQTENLKSEREALKICEAKIAAHKLEMHLVDAQYAFDNSKLLFYFTSEGRVDFRELVRDLAGVFRTRIELRQIGIRDESRLIGGLGMCGRPFCCSTFLQDFGQVSVKMAKEQGLSINTSKISGCCGRLMCCLRYEHESYAAEIALTPKKDTRVITPDGPGTVVDAAPLTGMVKVRRDDAPEAVPTPYHRDTLTVLPKRSETARSTDEGDKEPPHGEEG